MTRNTPWRRTLMATALALALAACGGESEQSLISSARGYLDKKDPKAAVIQLKNALQKNAQSPEARYLLGKALLASGDPVAAAVELRKAQELRHPDDEVIPELARAMLITGEEAKLVAQFANMKLAKPEAAADLLTTVAAAHVVMGDAAKGRDAAQAALQAKPMYPPAIVLQSRLKAADGAYDEALFLLEEVLNREPGHERAGTLRAEILWRGKQNPDAALAGFRDVLAKHPDSVAAATSAITILFQQNKPDDARQQFDALKKVAPNHPETLFFEAQLAFNDKDYRRCREITDRLLKAMPESARVLELAGAAEFRQRNYVQAEAFLGRALKNAPGALLSRQMLAQSFLRSGQPSRALEVLGPAVEGKSPDATSLALAGEAHLALGDHRASEAAFARAEKLAPGDTRVRTAAAMAQMARGNTSAGVATLEAVAAEDKGPRADLALVSARLRQNDVAGALKAIDAIEKKLPDRPLAHNLRGRVMLIKRDIPAATASFEKALSLDAKYFPAVASLAAIDLSAGKPDAARKRFDDFRKANPNSHHVLLAMAELSLRTGKRDEAVTLLRDAVKVSPGEVVPRLQLINTLGTLGDSKGALTAAQEAVAVMPNSPEALDALVRAQLAAGDQQQAVSTARRLVAAQPDQAMHQVRLADALVVAKDTGGAEKALRRALELQPDLVPAFRGLVALSLMDKKPQQALEHARQLQKARPKDPAGPSLEGDVESSRRAWDAAAAAYRTALQRANSADTAIKLHNALLAGGKSADAERLVADWLQKQPKDPAFRYYLGDLSLARGQLPQAEQHYRSVLEVQPRNALALNNVAWLMVRQGKPGAVALAEQANELMPERAPILDTLALALASEGNPKRAVEVQQRAVARSPQDVMLKLNLAKFLIKAGEKDRARAELQELAKLGEKFSAQAEVAALLKTL